MKKSYTSDYKTKLTLEVLREEETINEIASKYGVHPNQLSRWKKAVIDCIPEVLEDRRKKDVKAAEAQELIQELYAQIGELSSKLNWLKKKSGIDIR